MSLTQSDDRTPTQWIATGTIDSAGKVSLRGSFGFTDSNMCDLNVTSDAWSGVCPSATQLCMIEAQKVP